MLDARSSATLRALVAVVLVSFTAILILPRERGALARVKGPAVLPPQAAPVHEHVPAPPPAVALVAVPVLLQPSPSPAAVAAVVAVPLLLQPSPSPAAVAAVVAVPAFLQPSPSPAIAVAVAPALPHSLGAAPLPRPLLLSSEAAAASLLPVDGAAAAAAAPAADAAAAAALPAACRSSGFLSELRKYAAWRAGKMIFLLAARGDVTRARVASRGWRR